MKTIPVQFVLLQNLLAKIALKRGKFELILFIPFNNKLHGAIAKVADTIKQDNFFCH